MHQLLVNEKDNLNPKLMAMVQPLIDVDQYDSALFKSEKYISAKLKVFRSEIRTAFKFIRNDYAHNLKSIEVDQCYAVYGDFQRYSLLWKVSLKNNSRTAAQHSVQRAPDPWKSTRTIVVGVGAFSDTSRGLKLVPSKRRCLVPPTSGQR